MGRHKPKTPEQEDRNIRKEGAGKRKGLARATDSKEDRNKG